MKNIRIFYLKIFIILVVKFSGYLNRPVFVMIYPTFGPYQAKIAFGHAQHPHSDQPAHAPGIIRAFPLYSYTLFKK